MSRQISITKTGCAFLIGLCCILINTSVRATASLDRGWLKVERQNSAGVLGQPVSIEVVDSANHRHEFSIEGQARDKKVSLPAGWIQVNCRSKSEGDLLGHSVEIKKDKETIANCFFANPSSNPKVVFVDESQDTSRVEPSANSISRPDARHALKPTKSCGARGACGRAAKSSPRIQYVGPSSLEMGAAPPAPSFSSSGLSRVERFAGSLDREGYAHVKSNRFKEVSVSPTSTFSVDVDSASYANSRRFIEQMNRLPPVGAVRVEEFINYFDYSYSSPRNDEPFSIHTEVSTAPWNQKHRLVQIGLKAKSLPPGERPSSNLVFLIDVSGSMNSPKKLPLLKQAFSLLVNQLGSEDRVSIVVYASRQGLVLPSTPGSQKHTILSALSRLTAGGTTAGGAGIQLAYNEARKHFIKGGNNRVILATDGDFNVGVSSTAGLVKLIEKERASGVFLSVLGFGRGNYQDARMEELSNHGNGVAAYIDSLAEARKVLVNEAGSTLVTVAKDVKLQVEFNPLKVSQYRLIGYSNRMLNHEDFRDDKKDAGDMGAGHTVTALYEIVPNVEGSTGLDSGTFRYQKRSTETSRQNELLSFKVRFKKPDSAKSELRERVLIDHATPLAKTSNSFRFAAAVAQFGMILSKSNHVGNSNFNDVLALAEKALGRDKHQYRKGFVSLVRKALSLQSRQPARL